MKDFKSLNLITAHQGLLKKDFSSTELTRYFLSKVKEKDPSIKAFISVSEKEALKQAALVDKEISSGKEIGPLAGLPLAVKDNILIEGQKTTAGSKILADFLAPYDATVIKKLKQEKAVFLGKTNLDEFAMGSSTENSAFGPTKNPLNKELVPGGSSGGSAAAVKAGMCLYALGSDTGGSVRQPAAFCGLVGLKPTYGRVSRYGLISLTSSTDVIGTLTNTVEEAAVVLETIAGFDKRDAITLEEKVSRYSEEIKKKPGKIKIGLPKEYFGKELEPKVKKAFDQITKKLEKENFEFVEISLPHTEFAVAVYYIITPSEASTNLSRYDGVKYGLAAGKDIHDLIDAYFCAREKGFGPEPKRRIMLGTYALSAGYYEAYYLEALKVRRLLAEDFQKVFSKINLILTPTTLGEAFRLGAKQTPLEMYLSDIFLCASSLAGLPAISLPFYAGGPLPLGLQLIANHFEETKLLAAANIIEKRVLDAG